eukprot:5612934-Ditylum_brightwellii.AAC.1
MMMQTQQEQIQAGQKTQQSLFDASIQHLFTKLKGSTQGASSPINTAVALVSIEHSSATGALGI